MRLFRNKWLKGVITLVLLVIAGISIGVIIDDYRGNKKNLEQQQQLKELYQSSSHPAVEAESAQPEYANPQFAELLEINKDLVGWLAVGELETPVVQNDSNEYYLTHDFYGNEDPHGTVYVDTRNNVEQGDDNMVLYGHNYKKSKQIFYEVERYKDPEYAKAHPIVSFTSLSEKREYLVFAVFISNTEPSLGEVFDYHNKLIFTGNGEMDSFIKELRSRSLLTTDVEVDSFDQLITLSTCGYDFEGERIVLVARKLRGNEKAEDIASISYGVNPSPVMPEIWTRLYGSKA